MEILLGLAGGAAAEILQWFRIRKELHRGVPDWAQHWLYWITVVMVGFGGLLVFIYQASNSLWTKSTVVSEKLSGHPPPFRLIMHVTNAKYIRDYQVWLSFNDGTKGKIDLATELYGEVFEPLKDKEFFRSFSLEGHTLSWSNGADFAPEFLREQVDVR